ncbi:helix-turn-helix transcriptional regulator [Kitasatospora sp. NPDC092039]|uniref:helix-turn-helix transcriptional regulator n=1 Tax=Kitasatospora sp. NPDC092039 TaxID=3364086 RepID=UPI0038246047
MPAAPLFARARNGVAGWAPGTTPSSSAAGSPSGPGRRNCSWTGCPRSSPSRPTPRALQGHRGPGAAAYLTRWRIEAVARRLREGQVSLAAVARAVGYGSESALSVAFKRTLGVPPGDYRRHPPTAEPVRTVGVPCISSVCNYCHHM